MRILTSLEEQRETLAHDRTRITNRLRNALKQYYPQALDWFPRGVDALLFFVFGSRSCAAKVGIVHHLGIEIEGANLYYLAIL